MRKAALPVREPCSCHGAGCSRCDGFGIVSVRCNQCGQRKPTFEFLKDGVARVMANCTPCRGRAQRLAKLSPVERELERRPSRGGLEADGPLRAALIPLSGNRKTGPIPVSLTSASSCPPTCSYLGAGCYAERHMLGQHWRRLSAGGGLSWRDFCEQIRQLPAGQLWRHNEAGDLPGRGEALDVDAVLRLARAAAHTRGFTYTHKLGKQLPFLARERHFRLLRRLNESGVTVNLSIDDFSEIDSYAQYDLPMTAVLPEGADRVMHTRRGRKVVVCPAQINEGATCASCGICRAPGPQRAVVGFYAHGGMAALITDRLKPRRQLPLVDVQKQSRST